MKKLMIQLFVIAGVISGSSCDLQAAEVKIADKDVNFELYNKSKAAFKTNPTIKVFGGTILQSDIGSAKQKSDPIYSNVSRAQIKVDDPAKFGILVDILHTDGHHIYTIRPGSKTVFLSFSPDKSPNVYPQTGPLKGWLGKTESGLPLKNNLPASAITKGDTRTMWEKLNSR